MAKATKKKSTGKRKAWFTAYASSHRMERNKARRLRRHLTRFPSDKTAADSFASVKMWLGRA